MNPAVSSLINAYNASQQRYGSQYAASAPPRLSATGLAPPPQVTGVAPPANVPDVTPPTQPSYSAPPPLLGPSRFASNEQLENIASQVALRENARFEDLYVPALTTIAGGVNDTSIIDQAVSDAGTAESRAAGIRGRRLSRQGLTGTALDEREFDRTNRVSTSLSDTSDINIARLRQTARNEEFRDANINIGRGFSGTAQAGLNSAAANANARRNQADAAQAQQKASNTQAAVQTGATILLLAAGL